MFSIKMPRTSAGIFAHRRRRVRTRARSWRRDSAAALITGDPEFKRVESLVEIMWL
ncbi:hypothetical protein SBDP2_640010 [Syntrophobacter sp. SbD2]|nr:hypothetical protein SBDP2_640010 [Syntrophobacter sp. SbD2]